ncbi:MAG: sodium-dependent transporter [Chitinophagaceae bacterium]|nr:sodium-dependent transporter [Chitinophagaceae bacterium]
MQATRELWKSKFGFIMAAAGSAVGLGNIWRFPYLTGENGGAAFVLLYLLCVLFIGVPLLINEMLLGRIHNRNTIGAFRSTGANRFFQFFGGVLALAVSFFILSYYTVIAGWTLGYTFLSFSPSSFVFKEFIANSTYVLPLFAMAMLITIGIVLGGVSGGIEKANKIMMPMLFLILIIIIVRSVTLPNAMEGIKYYLVPDFSKINAMVFIKALTQAFFSLGIGWGIIITYGSYLPKNQSIVTASVLVGIMDTSVAFLAGLMIFPAVFSFGESPNQGPTLIFEVMAKIFPEMPFGTLIAFLFFLLLFIASITSTIAMVEVVGSWFIDEKKWSRKKATWLVGISAFIIGIPAALSCGANPVLSQVSFLGKQGVMDIMDIFFGTIVILIVVFTTTIYTGWFLKYSILKEELLKGSAFFDKKIWRSITYIRVWRFFLQYICPVIIIILAIMSAR